MNQLYIRYYIFMALRIYSNKNVILHPLIQRRKLKLR